MIHKAASNRVLKNYQPGVKLLVAAGYCDTKETRNLGTLVRRSLAWEIQIGVLGLKFKSDLARVEVDEAFHMVNRKGSRHLILSWGKVSEDGIMIQESRPLVNA